MKAEAFLNYCGHVPGLPHKVYAYGYSTLTSHYHGTLFIGCAVDGAYRCGSSADSVL